MSREVHGMVRGLNEVLRDRRMYTFVSKLEIMYIPMGQSLDPLCIIAGVPPPLGMRVRTRMLCFYIHDLHVHNLHSNKS